MKTFRAFLSIAVAVLLLAGCDQQTAEETAAYKSEEATELGVDSMLAQKLGADDYGMKKYVMAFLKAGPNRDQDSATAAKLQRAHLDNITRLINEGKLVLAGPFLDGGELRGIYIFNVTSIEEAKALTETDPAVKAGRLVMELRPWYGSAALQQVKELHEKIAAKQI